MPIRFKVNHNADDIRGYIYHGRIDNDQHKIELVEPSNYQINGDSLIRNNLHDPISFVEDEWFRQRNVAKIIEAP